MINEDFLSSIWRHR